MDSSVIRIHSVRPVHPPRQCSAATMGQPTREDGARSMVAVVIDRGLKSGKVEAVIVQPEKALELLVELAKSVEIAMRVNREFE